MCGEGLQLNDKKKCGPDFKRAMCLKEMVIKEDTQSVDNLVEIYPTILVIRPHTSKPFETTVHIHCDKYREMKTVSIDKRVEKLKHFHTTDGIKIVQHFRNSLVMPPKFKHRIVI